MLNFGNEFEARGRQEQAPRRTCPRVFRVTRRVFDEQHRSSSKSASERSKPLASRHMFCIASSVVERHRSMSEASHASMRSRSHTRHRAHARSKTRRASHHASCVGRKAPWDKAFKTSMKPRASTLRCLRSHSIRTASHTIQQMSHRASHTRLRAKCCMQVATSNLNRMKTRIFMSRLFYRS